MVLSHGLSILVKHVSCLSSAHYYTNSQIKTFHFKTRHYYFLSCCMSAVFSSALSSNAPKTRFAKSPVQVLKANNSNKPTNTYSNYQPSAQTTGGKWKRSIDEAGLDTQPNFGASADGSQPLAKNPRIGSPENGQVCSFGESRKVIYLFFVLIYLLFFRDILEKKHQQ